MNKNPFLPMPSYTPQQPPLPPGPPPPQPGQPDYSGWWAAQAQQPPAPQQPARPPAEQSALYANYGHQQQQQHQHLQQQHQPYHPPQVVQQPPPPPPPAAYTPYQPAAAAYPQPYPLAHPGYPHGPPQPQVFGPIIPHQQQQQPHQQPTQPRHHTSPQHPPAKRQRFDGPGGNRNHHGQPHHPQPPQPQFQPPPPPPQNNANFSGGRSGGIPLGPAARGGAPSGPGGRGGGPGARGGRGGSVQAGRGGIAGGRGRGGSFSAGHGGRGGAGGQAAGPANRQGNRNFGNKDFHNRRGGSSFGSGGGSGYSQSSSSSFRGGRNQGHQGAGRKNEGTALGSRDGTGSSSFTGKRDENRRTLTDFKIIGLAIPDLNWTWGTIPTSPSAAKDETKPEASDGKSTDDALTKDEDGKDVEPANAAEKQTETKTDAPAGEVDMAETSAQDPSPPPPSRIRIYFHTPVTADDSKPIPHNASYGDVPADSRKGKRKKIEDDDGDLDEIRPPPPPPQMADDRASAAGSVAPSVETASEADWLMAAIVEGEEESRTAAELQVGDEELDEAEQLQITQIVNEDEPEGEVALEAHDASERLFDGNSHDDEMNANEAENHSSESHPTTGDSSEAHNGSTENTSLFTGSPGRSSQVEGDQTSNSTDAPAEKGNASASSSLPVSHSSQSAADQPTNPLERTETQVSQQLSQQPTIKSLQSLSAEPTLLDIETQEASQTFDIPNGHEPTQIIDPAEYEHLPEPPESPAISNVNEDSPSIPAKRDNKTNKNPSANRLSISYNRSNRRLVINAASVSSLKLFRQDGRIEVSIAASLDDEGGLQGILTEGLSESTKSYSTLPASAWEGDSTVPPLAKAPSTSLQMNVYLDTARPLSEPKWAKSGDVQDWLKSMFGRMFWVAGDAADGWEKKIQVVDPDPPPTIWTVLDGWAANSPVGALNERQRFLKTHLSEVDNLLEILLRLVRGERATPFSHSAPTISAPSVSGPLLSALTPGSAHATQQTHVSLAVLAILRMATEFAEKASGEEGKKQVEERVGEIIRCLPSHLLYKSLDGIFKEWRVEKKGRYTYHKTLKQLANPTRFRNTYDSDNTIFSPRGQLHQVEYALEAVKQGSAAVGLRSKTHAVLLALKRSTGELASYQQKMFRIDDHVGIAIAGLTSDARVLSNFMRQQAMASKMLFNRPVPVNRLVSSIADKAQVNTQEYGRRPYGVGFLVIGQDKTGPHLYEFQPSGNSYEYYAMSIGARSQSAKTYLEKHYESFADASLEDLVRHGLHALRETLQQDKELNVNNTSIGILGPVSEKEKPVAGGLFRILENEAVQPFLETMIAKVVDPAVAPAAPATQTTDDSDVQMAE
ncbi:hypothetical protein CPB83DRAFT_866259 [Crepidotus variabilis]|uniref:Proteasome alpha-type subunits domain-containing protein n=1 Tax=Crepidotus variabilis TaxID=179855 RepID=A0A9P6JV25_9AGAR|nr:hypothetical protein CPB83DRAFT_866259 [Crepidotus variabilis]